MLRGNLNINCWKTKNNQYAETELGEHFVERGWVLEATSKREKSSIRTDASASRGRSEIDTGELRLLLEVDTRLRKKDVAQPVGHLDRYEIEDIRPRYDISGKLDHYEARCSIWQE